MFTRSWKFFDWPFFMAVSFLSLVGLIMIYSTGLGGKEESFLWARQLLALAIGMGGLFFFSNLDYRFFQKNSSFLYLAVVVLLIVVILFGQEIRGTRRWFDLGLFNFQPAELSKFVLIVVLAKYFQRNRPFLVKFSSALFSFLYVLIPVALIMWQPDLGSAAIHIVIWLGMLLVTPMPRRYFLYLLVIFLVVAAVSWQFFLHDYQKDRLRTFFSPTTDPLGRGYNVIQSIVAVGSGGIFGRGLARGLQSQLKFLPERQTDFLFAATVEELGIIGGGLILALFWLVFWRMLRILRDSRDLFGAYLATGAFFLIFFQAIINIGMNLGLFPVTGVTLPFLSYGGSSLVVMFWLVGVMENIKKNSAPVKFG